MWPGWALCFFDGISAVCSVCFINFASEQHKIYEHEKDSIGNIGGSCIFACYGAGEGLCEVCDEGS